MAPLKRRPSAAWGPPMIVRPIVRPTVDRQRLPQFRVSFEVFHEVSADVRYNRPRLPRARETTSRVQLYSSYCWLLLATAGYRWLPLATAGHRWLPPRCAVGGGR